MKPSTVRADDQQAGPHAISLLGSTGSIGTQTLDIVRLFPERLRVHALTAFSNVELLAAQARLFRPDYAVIGDEQAYGALKKALVDTDTRVLAGRGGLRQVAASPEVDVVVAAVVGFAGLESVLAALEAGKTVALANKETLVAAGALVETLLQRRGGTLLPIDSEHSAIFQCLVGEPVRAVEKLILTASGGPFRTRDAGTFASIKPEEALQHPNWDMGAKVTIDSATMMNKGLEVIEARWLFGLPGERIEVLVHPQSIIHSMVAFADGSTKAQLGVPDMKVPIQYALSYPGRWSAPHERLDWSTLSCLDFEQPDTKRFPCLRLAYEALAQGGTAPAVLNAANEAAVVRFLQHDIRFTDIPSMIERAVLRLGRAGSVDYNGLVAADAEARRLVQELNPAAAN